MKVEFVNKKLTRIIDEQFKIIGLDIKFENVQEYITVNKKKVIWYEHYLFDNVEQYEKWKSWAIKEMKKMELEDEFMKLDLIYGLNFKIKKEGQLF